MLKLIKIMLLFIVLLSIIVSGEGLEVIDNNKIITKDLDVNKSLSFDLKNNYNKTLYNISFDDNNYIYMPLTTLSAGETKTINAIVFGNQDVNTSFNIKGFYQSDLGISNESYEINIYYSSGIDICDLTIIKGDTVKWFNNVLDEIKLINSQTSIEISTITQNSSYSSTFSIPETLNYYGTRRGFKFTSDCKIICLDTQGLINNPQLDGSLHLDLDVEYLPTTLEYTFLEDNYSLEYYKSEEGIFLLKNIGSNDAKGVKLSGSWFSFSQNNFNIESGKTKSISYTITPSIQNTSDTNKNYVKTIKVEGNFPTLNKDINIFIPYANVDESNYSGRSLGDLLIEFCADNPDVCNPDPEVVYRDSNDSMFNATMSEEQLKELFGMWFEQKDEFNTFYNYMKEIMYNMAQDLNNTKTNQSEIASQLKDIEEGKETINSFLYLVFGIIILGGICGFSVSLIILYKKKKLVSLFKRGHLVEKT